MCSFALLILLSLLRGHRVSSVVCVYKPFTYRKPLPLRTKAFYVQKPLRTKAFTHKSLYACTYYFSTTLAMRAALKSKRTTLLALLSFPRAIWPVPRWRAAWHDSWAKFPEKGGGCVVVSRRPKGVQ